MEKLETITMMSKEILWFFIGTSGSVILICFSIIGFFLRRIVSDLKQVIEENGKNKGRIELVEQQQQNDIKRIEQMTQMELKLMSEKVREMSDNVKTLSDNVNTLVFGKGLDGK